MAVIQPDVTMVPTSKTARQNAKRKHQRATETEEEREERLSKRRAQYAARRQRATSSVETAEAKEEIVSLPDSESSSTSSERWNATKRQRRVQETPEQRQQRLEKERAFREKENEKRRKQRAEETPQQRQERSKKRQEKSLAKAGPTQTEGHIAVERREEHARRVKEFETATREFNGRFTNNAFGYACTVRDRLWHRDKLTPQQVSQSQHAVAAPSSESSSQLIPESQALQSQVPTPSSDGSSYTLPQVRKCQCSCHPVMITQAVQTALPQLAISTQTSSTPLQFSQAHLCRCCCHYSMSTTAMQTAPDFEQLATSSSHSQTAESCLLVSRRNAGVQVHLSAYICLSVASQTTFH
ncbi:uncharacterized protein [Dermacentor andersoni]|uniref:uncharacterized protein isoform X1 n=1 Tax=Dermacentor andersoni TaxID=34620 RepID=UPI003B3A745F